jgi:hypothetical protein
LDSKANQKVYYDVIFNNGAIAKVKRISFHELLAKQKLKIGAEELKYL